MNNDESIIVACLAMSTHFAAYLGPISICACWDKQVQSQTVGIMVRVVADPGSGSGGNLGLGVSAGNRHFNAHYQVHDFIHFERESGGLE